MTLKSFTASNILCLLALLFATTAFEGKTADSYALDVTADQLDYRLDTGNDDNWRDLGGDLDLDWLPSPFVGLTEAVKVQSVSNTLQQFYLQKTSSQHNIRAPPVFIS